MPESIAPMQATLAARPPAGDGWIYEIKWDGVRALCFVESGTLRILSRNGNRCELQYPELTVLPHYLRAEQAILDGEIVVLDERGVSRFELIQQRIGAADAAGIARMARSRPATLYLFDLIYLDGYDLRKVELAGRKRALAAVAAPGERVRLSEHFTGGEELLEAAAEMGLEGIVAKRLDSGYQSRRGREWLKVKLVTEEEFLICGFTQGERDYFGALVLGARREGGLIWVGAAHARADVAEDVVGDGARHARDLLRVEPRFILLAEQRDLAAASQARGVAHVDGDQVHGDRAENRDHPAIGDHAAAVREAVEDAVRVARPDHRDAHGPRRAERSAVAYQGALGNFFDFQHPRFPGERRLHVDHRLRRAAPGRREIPVDGVPGPHHVVPGFPPPIPDGVGAGHVDQIRTHAGALERGQQLVKRGRLPLGLLRGVVRGRREVRHQPFEAGMPGGADGIGDRARTRQRSQPVHAAVDLEVVTERLAGGERQCIQLTDLAEFVHRGGELIFRQRLALVRQKAGHHQDAGANAVRAQRDALVHRADAEPARALGHQHARNFHGAVAVGVGLHHPERFYAGADRRAHAAVVAGNLIARNDHVGTKKRRGHCSYSRPKFLTVS